MKDKVNKAPPFSFQLESAIPYLLSVWAGNSLKNEKIANPAIQYLVFETLRDFGWGEFILQKLAPKGVANLKIKALLFISFSFLRLNPTRSFMLVDQSVAAAKNISPRLSGFVNAVLRNFLRQQNQLNQAIQNDEIAFFKHPKWWIKHLKKDYPNTWQEILINGNRASSMALRINPLKTNLKTYKNILFEKNIPFTVENNEALLLEKAIPSANLPFFNEGFCHIQDLGAQSVWDFLKELKNENALDMCAAPGGKAALWLENVPNLHLTALEIDKKRTQDLENYLKKYNLNARIIQMDCLQFESNTPFDSILCDCPCTGSGVVGRHPDAKWVKQESDIQKFANLQNQILQKAWQLLKTGGRLIFATCSVFKLENEYNIAAFLENEKSAKMINQKTILPSVKNDGFFYALLEKR